MPTLTLTFFLLQEQKQHVPSTAETAKTAVKLQLHIFLLIFAQSRFSNLAFQVLPIFSLPSLPWQFAWGPEASAVAPAPHNALQVQSSTDETPQIAQRKTR